VVKRYRVLWLAVIAAFVLSPIPNWITDTLFFPWVHADPPLFGRWAGDLTAGDGHHLDLVMVLRRKTWSDEGVCTTCSQLQGTAVTCDAQGTVRRYDVDGSPKDRQGHELHIGALSAESPPPEGLELDTLIGSWDGADTLTLMADFVWRQGGSSVSSIDDPATQPVPVRLQRRGTADAQADQEGQAPACE